MMTPVSTEVFVFLIRDFSQFQLVDVHQTMATFRILGLDSGADIIVCVPPTAYATW